MAKTMIPSSKFISSIAIIIVSICISRNQVICDGASIGFTIDLIHRDSPQSPTYNSSQTSSQRLAIALKRSFNRIHRFKKHDPSTQTPVSDLIRNPYDGEYLMKYSIGSPPFTTFGIADTGSDITWTQCSPCQDCFKQKLPLFKPKKSSTYKIVPCTSKICNTSYDYGCNNSSRKCEYYVTYGDRSTSNGDVARDTLTLGSSEGKNISIPNFVFGCGYQNTGKFSQGESGIVGLGSGKPSLISQLDPSIQGKFSYCLVSASFNGTKSNKINFGSKAEVSGQGVVSTPLDTSFYYYLILEGISIENQTLGFLDPSSSDESNFDEGGIDIIIDSGTVLTFLPFDLYASLEKAVKSRIKLPRIKDPLRALNLCYRTRESISLPDVVFHFKGADVRLKPDNVFIRTSDISWCLAFAPGDNPSIYGNVAQGNFLIGYDLKKRTLSFKPTDCSKC